MTEPWEVAGKLRLAIRLELVLPPKDLCTTLVRIEQLEKLLHAAVGTHGEPCDRPDRCEFVTEARNALGLPAVSP